MRKTVTLTIEDRGNPLKFEIREMPATKLESWIIRAVLLLASSGADVPEGTDIQRAGAYLATHGIKALGSVDYEKARPLLDDLLSCCQRILDGGVRQEVTAETLDGYIEDVRTLFTLRVEALKLNLGFFGADGLFASPLKTPDV